MDVRNGVADTKSLKHALIFFKGGGVIPNLGHILVVDCRPRGLNVDVDFCQFLVVIVYFLQKLCRLVKIPNCRCR